MRKKCFVIGMVLVCSMTLFATSTWAGCEQGNLAGNWAVQVGATDSSGDHCWEYCTLTINSSGAVAAGDTYYNCSGSTCQITGGLLTVSSGCIIQGTIETSHGSLNVIEGTIVGDELFLQL